MEQNVGTTSEIKRPDVEPDFASLPSVRTGRRGGKVRVHETCVNDGHTLVDNCLT